MGKNTSFSSNDTPSSTSSSPNNLFGAVNKYKGRELVDQLRELGLDQYVELPQIAVMGDTSSGKSSLLSALSGVAFPSSSELTTRCPTQLILSRGDVFSGKVRLHRYKANHSEHHGELAGISDVPLAIERLTNLLVEEGQHISDDSIIIELRDKNLPNLTLTDLPGIVRAVSDKEDKSIIPRVRAMVNRYMKQTRTVIMAVVPATVDMHNVEILENAQEADLKGERTIAVVTKLDLVDAGAERGIEQLLLNRKKRLELGYHAVKCRGQKDLDNGVQVAQGLAQESAFFANHPFWSRLKPETCGIPTLTQKLVNIMHDNIVRTMPLVQKELDQQINDAMAEEHELGSLLDTPSTRRQAFGQWVDRFLASMQAVLKGDYEAVAGSTVDDVDEVDVRLRAQIRLCDEIFKATIHATAKTMPGSNDKATLAPGDLVEVDNRGQVEIYRVDDVRDGGDVLCSAYSKDDWLGASRYTPHKLNHLRRFIVENRGDELPIFPPYTVFCNILRQWVDTWEAPMFALVEQYRKLTLTVAEHVVETLNLRPKVVQYLRVRMEAAIKDLHDAAIKELQHELARERRPFTQNSELTQTYKQLLRPGLETLLKQRMTMHDQNRVDFGELLTVLTEFGNENDEHETVLMDCSLRAYFETARKRFVDVVPMRLNDTMLHGFVTRMRNDLQAMTDEQLDGLLREPEASRMRRAGIIDKLTTLRRAKQKIDELSIDCS